MKLTLSEARATVGRAVGMCPTDSRIPTLLNEAVQRLLPRGKWVGTYPHYRFCTSENCITLPRQLETLEAAAICRTPMPIRNEWYQFISEGLGILRSEDCDLQFSDRGGGFVSFDDVKGTDKVLRVYSDTAEDASAKILLQFYNQSGNYVRTLDGSRWINGEKVAISTTPNDTANQCIANGWVGVQKPVTNGTVYVYEYNTLTTDQRLLARYEPDETMPDYRRYLVPGLSRIGSCCSNTNTSDCTNKTIEAIAKARFIPVAEPEDLLMLGNIGALKLACMAIQKEENNLMGEASIYWNGGMVRVHGVPVRVEGAIPLLEDELDQYLGDGPDVPIQIQNQLAEAGAVFNLL